MAYAITQLTAIDYQTADNQRFKGIQIEAVLDTADDLTALGNRDSAGNYYAPGSIAIVAEGGAVYMLNASHEWAVFAE